VSDVAEGAPLALSPGAQQRIRAAHRLVESVVRKGVRAYGVNTGWGALCDVVVKRIQTGAAVAKYRDEPCRGGGARARGDGGARHHRGRHQQFCARLFPALRVGRGWTGCWRFSPMICVPDVPVLGVGGYLTHMAHIALVLIGEGQALSHGRRSSGAEALQSMQLAPLVLGAKEGLCLVNGTPCATGLSGTRLGEDGAAARLGGCGRRHGPSRNCKVKSPAFDPEGPGGCACRRGWPVSVRPLRTMLTAAAFLRQSAGRRTQDPLSLRAVPAGAWRRARFIVARGPGRGRRISVGDDNPVVVGTPDEPRALSGRNAVGAALGLNLDSLGIAVAEIAAMSERAWIVS